MTAWAEGGYLFITLIGLLLAKNDQSDDRMLGVDCVQYVVQRSFDHVDHLEP